MTTEKIEYLMTAEDEATAKIRKAEEAVKAHVKQVREVGGQAKSSTEFVGTMANVMGGSQFAGFAGQMAQVAERVSAFSEVSKAGGAGALAFKAGLVGLVGVISVQVGKALGDLIFQTGKWNEALAESKERLEELAAGTLKNAANRFNKQKELFGLIVDPDEQEAAFQELKRTTEVNLKAIEARVKKSKEDIKAMDKFYRLDVGSGELENKKAALEADKQQLRLYKEQSQELAGMGSEYDKAIELKKKEHQAIADAAAASKKAEEDRINAIIKKNQEKMKANGKEIDERNAKNKKALDAELAAKKKIQDTQTSTLDGFKLQVAAIRDGEKAANKMRFEMMGIDEATAKGFADIDAMIKKINEPKTGGGGATSLTTTDERLLSGRGENQQSKLVEQNKKIANNSDKEVKLLENMIVKLESLNNKQPIKIETVGD